MQEKYLIYKLVSTNGYSNSILVKIEVIKHQYSYKKIRNYNLFSSGNFPKILP